MFVDYSFVLCDQRLVHKLEYIRGHFFDIDGNHVLKLQQEYWYRCIHTLDEDLIYNKLIKHNFSKTILEKSLKSPLTNYQS